MGCILTRGLSKDSFLHICDFIRCIPCVPCLCGRFKGLPLVGSTWMGACFQHCVHRDEEQGKVRDWFIAHSTLRFLLRGLECVDVFKDSLTICVVVLHLILECKHVDYVQSTTYGLEVGQKLSWSDLCEKSFFIFQLQDLSLINPV